MTDEQSFFVSYAHQYGFGMIDIIGSLPVDFADMQHIKKVIAERDGAEPETISIISWQKYDG